MNFILSFFFAVIFVVGGVFVYDTYKGRTFAKSLGESILLDIAQVKESACDEKKSGGK